MTTRDFARTEAGRCIAPTAAWSGRNFCAGCGRQFEPADALAVVADDLVVGELVEDAGSDWRHETHYAVLLYFPEVRPGWPTFPPMPRR